MSDPKGAIHVKAVLANREAMYDPPITKLEAILTKLYANDPKMGELFKEVKEFMSTRPYGFETVFGYTHLIDTERKLRKFIFDRDVPGAGLDEAECLALDYLRAGNFFSSTGL